MALWLRQKLGFKSTRICSKVLDNAQLSDIAEKLEIAGPVEAA